MLFIALLYKCGMWSRLNLLYNQGRKNRPKCTGECTDSWKAMLEEVSKSFSMCTGLKSGAYGCCCREFCSFRCSQRVVLSWEAFVLMNKGRLWWEQWLMWAAWEGCTLVHIHRIMECPELERTSRIIKFHASCGETMSMKRLSVLGNEKPGRAVPTMAFC